VRENPLIASIPAVGKLPLPAFKGVPEPEPTTLPQVYLHPGQAHVASDPANLKMILGSCAGVFLFDPILRIGGATHFMLPLHGEGQPSPRYGDVAIAELLRRFRALGSQHRNIQARIFGGACVLQALQNIQGSIGNIGQKNVEIAIDILGREGVEIIDKNVFGNRGRKVSMISHTGEIKLGFLSNADGH
jgi:chemotaxis protein CheD